MKHQMLIGDICGALTVQNRSAKAGWFECQCVCGQIVDVFEGDLLTNARKSCGVVGHAGRLAYKRHSQGKSDLCRGRRYGYLTVLDVPDGGKTRSMIPCKCDCGVLKEVRRDYLMNGRSKSCGCMRSSMARNRLSLQQENKALRATIDALKSKQHALLKSRELKPMQVIGATFGALTVYEMNRVTPDHYNCKCTCGGIRTVSLLDLVSGKVAHCNARKAHKTPVVARVWQQASQDNLSRSVGKSEDQIFMERMAAQKANLEVRK